MKAPTSLDTLAHDIMAAHTAALGASASALEHARRAGDLLIHAKAQLRHCEWLPWLAANCDVSIRMVQVYTQIARGWPRLEELRNTYGNTHLDITAARRVLANRADEEEEEESADQDTSEDDLGDGGCDGTDDSRDDDTGGDSGEQTQPTAHLSVERKRLQREIDNLVESIAAGVPATTVAPKIRERERELASIDAQLRAPRPETVDRERLRAALEQRTEAWRQELRAEPRVARLLLRRLIEPIVLHEETSESRERLIEWEAKPMPAGLLDGLYNMLASPTGTAPLLYAGVSGRFLSTIR